jgi:hypothetical protein
MCRGRLERITRVPSTDAKVSRGCCASANADVRMPTREQARLHCCRRFLCSVNKRLESELRRSADRPAMLERCMLMDHHK